MIRQQRSARRNDLLRLTLLAGSLAAAIADVSAANPGPETVSAIPLSWPLPYERDAGITPLRAQMDAMRIARPAPSSHVATVLPVTRCDDDSAPGSLRDAVNNAVSGDVIDLTQITCSRISLSEGALKILIDDLTFLGPGADALTIEGDDKDRVLFHPASGTLQIENLTIAHGRHTATGNAVGYGGCIATAAELVLIGTVVRDCFAQGVGSYGGAVLSGFMKMSQSTISGSTAFGDHPTNGTAAYGGGAFSYGVSIIDSTISGNSAIGTHNPPLSHWEIGGGLFIARNGGSIERTTIADNYAIRFAGGLTQEGDLILRNSTISGNTTRDDDGGGMRVRQATAVTIENTTIAHNHAGSNGSGISFIDNALPSTVQSSIIANNTSGTGAADINSTMPLVISGSHNLIQTRGANLTLPSDTLTADPQLLPLANNGGLTRTHALAVNSPAIDRGSNPEQLATDQRGIGYPREFNVATDIGAYEFQGAAPAAVALPGPRASVSILMAALLALFGAHALRTSTRKRVART
jgi:hypothetical protein